MKTKSAKRRAGFRRIEDVKHGPFTASIFMDGDGVFHCEIGAEHNSGPLTELRKWATSVLRAKSSIRWQPVLQVQVDTEDTSVNALENCSNLACHMERFWIAWDGSKWIQCPWVVDAPGVVMCFGPANSDREQDDLSPDVLMAQRIMSSRAFHEGPNSEEIKWPLIGSFMSDRVYFVPYTDEHWQTMVGIMQKIRDLRAGINRLMGSMDGWNILAKVAEINLLAAPDVRE